MSKNRKNIPGKTFMYNFTTDIINRMILANKSDVYTESLSDNMTLVDKLKLVKNEVNYNIQLLNLIVPRNIPYLSIAFCYEPCDNMRLCFRQPLESSGDLLLQIDDRLTNYINITHLLDYYAVSGIKEIKNSNNKNIDMKINADMDLSCVVINDIFIDIAYFNSFSFLRQMTTAAKKKFSKKKAEYFKKNNLTSFFDKTDENDLEYYSFAFSCHTRHGKSIGFDINKYIRIWDDFIQQYFPNEIHVERSVQEQIEMRVDEHIPKDYYKKFIGKEKGNHFLLRINKTGIPEKYVKYVCNLFGIPAISDGQLCILSYEELNNSLKNHKDLYENLYISVFKVVVQ